MKKEETGHGPLAVLSVDERVAVLAAVEVLRQAMVIECSDGGVPNAPLAAAWAGLMCWKDRWAWDLETNSAVISTSSEIASLKREVRKLREEATEAAAKMVAQEKTAVLAGISVTEVKLLKRLVAEHRASLVRANDQSLRFRQGTEVLLGQLHTLDQKLMELL